MAKRILAVCLDFGDTLGDQATQVRDDAGTLLEIDLIEGALELVRELRARGYRLALVADGTVRDARNVLAQHGLDALFDAVVISEAVGAQKPDPSIFHRALGELGLEPRDYARAVMVGNRLERDVQGARQLGMIAVWIDWSPRYAKRPTEPAAVPDRVIEHPLELLPLLERLEREHG
ncbi:MAG: HAD-IA family hydrolase [Thermoleophilaceae bacterium]|nr:HAD-IA family hydrolase [Thermoleophilaceae bacterium]